jgi:Tfp pilus tip-associated adhesin PilY1
LAGVAAHGGNLNIGAMVDPLTVTYPSSGSISAFAPFWVKKRGTGSDAMTFSYPHPIQTMTVGVSLGVNWSGSPTQPIALNVPPISLNSDITSAKYRLLATATFGDPRKTTYNIATAIPYTVNDGVTDSNSVYFFDGTAPQTLVDNLDRAFKEAASIANQNSNAVPTVPFVGLGLASQIYLGNFTPPKEGGPVWPGDLLMFPTKQVNGETVILDKAGAPVSTTLSASNATWAASAALYNRKWDQRKIWTRLPATTSVPSPALIPFMFKPTSGSTTQFDAIKAYIATSSSYTEAQKSDLIKFIMGADLTLAAQPNRSTIMGDVINSAPAVVEYTLTDAIRTGLPATLSAALSAHSGARFRVLFVGTNQGMFHAFGEISWTDSTTDPANPITRGAVDELWAFVPTDFLANLDYMQTVNTHRFLVDGSPYVYHLDLPVGTNLSGNGTIDSTETARVIFGLRKGGRSYYALNITDPFTPSMAWAVSADESATIPTSRVEYSDPTKAKTVIKNLGFSTSTISVGRVQYGTTAPTLRDAVFLGGGLSTTEVDAEFTPALLGRSALAVDASNGNILNVWDFSTTSGTTIGIGSVSTGLVPFEYFLNSGLVQRAYFTDSNGSLWALGSGKTTTASDGKSYRRDSSNLGAWTTDGNFGSMASVRKVYTGATNEYISTVPAPFLTGNVPLSAGTIPVGIALVSGDRNNPLDRNYTTATMPTRHRLTVVFDNQEATLGTTPILTTNLYDVPDSPAGTTPPEVVPGSSSYYLAKGKRGYDILFPAKTGGFLPKGINEPLVLGGALLFSYFMPTLSDPCSGGSGTTSTNRVCDVLAPVYMGNTTLAANAYGVACQGGQVFTWSGVATSFSARSTVTANQAGMLATTGGTAGGGSSTTSIRTIFGQVKDRLPRPRTWRTVH